MSVQPTALGPESTTACCQEPLIIDEDADQELATCCKALGHPLRVRILRILLQRKSCVCGELVEMLPVAQSTVSEHLKILKQAGLVQGEVDGPRVCYCVHPGKLERLKLLVAAL